MKFAVRTLKDITGSDADRRRQAVFAIVLWFLAGAFVVSTLQLYILPYEGILTQIIGGTLVSLFAVCLKLT